MCRESWAEAIKRLHVYIFIVCPVNQRCHVEYAYVPLTSGHSPMACNRTLFALSISPARISSSNSSRHRTGLPRVLVTERSRISNSHYTRGHAPFTCNGRGQTPSDPLNLPDPPTLLPPTQPNFD